MITRESIKRIKQDREKLVKDKQIIKKDGNSNIHN